MKLLPVLLAGLVALAPAGAAERIVSTAGAITETLFALGVGPEVVAVDVSSVYPTEATGRPKVGYARQLSAEGILSLNPTVVFVTTDAGPPEVLQQLQAAKVRVVTLKNDHTPEAAAERIRQIGAAVGRDAAAGELVNRLQADLAEAGSQVAAVAERPRVLFIYARGGGTMNVAGRDTSAEAIIALSGGVNAVNGFSHYKPLTAEAAVEAAPEVILVTTRGLEASGGMEGLLKQPGLSLTPAGRTGRVVAMDDLLLLGFGPRLGRAARELCDRLHPPPTTASK
jgi:iron complex transport system substrate-binding protein